MNPIASGHRVGGIGRGTGLFRAHAFNPIIIILLTGLLASGGSIAATVTFEEIVLNEAYGGLGGGSYYNGSAASGGIGDWDGTFSSGGASFPNSFSEIDFGGGTFTAWSGFAVSSTSDISTPGFQNQYSAFAAGPTPGASDSSYGIGFGPTRVDFGRPVLVSDAFIANTTYAALSMRFGDAFATAFGDDPGTAVVEDDFPSWFLLSIRGALGGVPVAREIDLYLADYRFTDDSLDFILDDWTSVDLTPLGTIDELSFELTSSDTSPFGINTPAYFAIDQITYTEVAVPEPGTSLMLAISLLPFLLNRQCPRARR